MTEPIIVTFNGVNLTELISIIDLDRGMRLGRSFSYLNRRNKRGVDRDGYGSELVSFPMSFAFYKDIKEKRKQIMEVLNVDEPKELTFSDEPGIVYYAIPQGNISIEEKTVKATGTIIWEIPDGVSHSVAEYRFTNKVGSNLLQDYIMVNNPGTEPMELTLEATFSSDNGYLGIDTALGAALFGDMTEVDKEPYEKSEVLFNDHMYNDKDWARNSGKVPPVTPNPRQAGTVGFEVESIGEGYVYAIDYGTVVNDWSGPSLTKTVPADSEGAYAINWTSDFRLDFNTDGSGTAGPAQVGHQSITYLDQNNNIIVSIVIEDNYGYAEKSDLAIYVRNKRVYDSRNTTNYYYTARPGSGNHFYVEKTDEQILIRLVRNNDPKQFDYLFFPFTEKNVQLRKVTWYAARYKGHEPINNNLLRAITVTKLNVQKWDDIPNKFMNGDILRYGKNGRNIYCTVNNMNELRLRDVGSKTIKVPSGQSIIYIAYSDFSDTPEIVLKGRARYTI